LPFINLTYITLWILQLLSRIDTVTCSQIVALIVDSSQTQGSMTGQEIRDVLFARLFGLTAIIRSGLLVRNTPLSTSSSSEVPVSSLSSYQAILTQLLTLGDRKSWLRESAWWSVVMVVDVLEASDVTWKEDAVKATLNSIFAADSAWTPEKVALAAKLQKLYPNEDWKSALSPVFKNFILLSPANLNAIARILKVGTVRIFTLSEMFDRINTGSSCR
jgi:DNA polymerase phi